MPRSVLLVPVHLDALFVQERLAVVPPTADWSLLPHVRDRRDVNAAVPWLGEAIASRPFQEHPFWLDRGVHLHWALPDALCRTVEAEGEGGARGLVFPRVPDRWLVTKRWTSSGQRQVEQWVVESDYLHPAGAAPRSPAIAYPSPAGPRADPGDQPFRYLGRTLSLERFRAGPQRGDAYLPGPLTALGYGEPTFAAFYPNCHSVFGFHDRGATTPLPEELSYEVLGWYADPAHDHLRGLVERAGPAPALARLGWEADGAPVAGEPPLMVCQGRLTFRGREPEKAPPLRSRFPTPEITFGNTVAEALSAHLAGIAEDAGQGKKDEIENQLEAVLDASKLDARQTDLLQKFEEARHAKGFAPAPPAPLWAIRPAGDDPSGEARPLDWPDASRLLVELNALQRDANATADELLERRRQLVADWHKYMRCAHAPEGGAAGLPGADDVRRFVEAELPAVERLAAAGAELEARIASKAAEVRSLLDAKPMLPIGGHPPMLEVRRRFVLQRTVAPRFFQPAEPVVLLTGSALKNTHRYARGAGPRGRGGRLLCLWTQLDAGVPERLDAVASALTAAKAWDERDWSPPWHPFLMEWEVELRPFERLAGALAEDAVTKTFTLRQADVDLSPRRSAGPPAPRGQRYSGASLLTPHGVDPYLEALRERMERGDLPALDGRDPGEEGDSPEGGGVISGPPDDPSSEKLGAFGKRLSEAQRALRSLSGMAQSLGGLNDALRTNRLVLQLPVDDPLGFPAERALAARVRAATGGRVRRSPRPEGAFHPIRAGELRLVRLRVVDTFGQSLDVDPAAAKCRSSRTLPLQTGAAVMLPPRLVQPARLHFRWHAAGSPDAEAHDHPDATPISGWVVANRADESLFVHAGDGRVLGSLEVADARVRWRSAPGLEPPIADLDAGIPDRALRRLVRFFLSGTEAFFRTFLADLEAAQSLIEPEDPGQALLMGRPLALVRACLKLQLQGPPAIDQSWSALRADLRGGQRATGGLPSVRFPIRLGERDQLDDGLTVYFAEDARGDYDGYVIPSYEAAGDGGPPADPKARQCDFLYQSAGSPSLMVTMLVDPRGVVHASTGILPAKSIAIPRHHAEEALRRIETSFLAAPLLTERGGDAGALSVPLADEPGRSWTFVERQGRSFAPPRPVRAAPLHAPFAAPVVIREGWIRLARSTGDTPDE